MTGKTLCKTIMLPVMIITLTASTAALAGSVDVPPGMFKDLNDATVGGAIIINGKQLFIDDYIIEQLNGAEKILNQPVKHPDNPLVVQDQPWEENGPGYSTVMYDEQEGIFKLWYGFWWPDAHPSEQALCYATSEDGITWEKPIINQQDGTNIVFQPQITGFQAAGIYKDPVETDPARRYKMLFSAAPDGTSKTWSVNAAYSPDGIYGTGD